MFRQWPPERFAKLADFLVETHDADLVFTGIESEVTTVAEVITRLRHPDRAIVCLGQRRSVRLPPSSSSCRSSLATTRGRYISPQPCRPLRWSYSESV